MTLESKPTSLESPVTQVIPLKGWRKILAERMLASHVGYAEVTQMREVDATQLDELRRKVLGPVEAKFGVRVSHTHLLIKAIADALKKHPIINSSVGEEGIKLYSEINIGMAVALEDGGLLTPVIRQADKKSIVDIAKDAVKLAEAVRTRRMSLDILQGGTFTITNAGMYGTDFVTPLINLPQSAALGVGRMVPKPVVRNKEIVVRTMMGLSLTYDHRIITGATAAQFFQTLEKTVESISTLDLGIDKAALGIA